MSRIFKQRIGISLIETMVAVGLFGIIISVATAMFTSSLSGQSQVLSLKRVQEEARFISQFIQKEARHAQRTYSGSPCLGMPDGAVYEIINSSKVRFQNQTGECVVYDLQGEGLKRSVDNGSSWDNLSSPDVKVRRVRFELGTDTAHPLLDYQFEVSHNNVKIFIDSKVSARVF